MRPWLVYAGVGRYVGRYWRLENAMREADELAGLGVGTVCDRHTGECVYIGQSEQVSR